MQRDVGLINPGSSVDRGARRWTGLCRHQLLGVEVPLGVGGLEITTRSA